MKEIRIRAGTALSYANPTTGAIVATGTSPVEIYGCDDAAVVEFAPESTADLRLVLRGPEGLFAELAPGDKFPIWDPHRPGVWTVYFASTEAVTSNPGCDVLLRLWSFKEAVYRDVAHTQAPRLQRWISPAAMNLNAISTATGTALSAFFNTWGARDLTLFCENAYGTGTLSRVDATLWLTGGLNSPNSASIPQSESIAGGVATQNNYVKRKAISAATVWNMDWSINARQALLSLTFTGGDAGDTFTAGAMLGY